VVFPKEEQRGDFLQWKIRAPMIQQEILRYGADIISLQEIDILQWPAMALAMGIDTKGTETVGQPNSAGVTTINLKVRAHTHYL